LPPVVTTVAAAATAPSQTTGAPATSPPTTLAPTVTPTTVGPTSPASSTTVRPIATTVPASPVPPCQLALIVEQTQTAYLGITPSDLSCAEDWAAWIGRPEDEFGDGFFAVARWTGASWELVNLGTAGVCADAGVPAELWTELECFE
jgi:hypothetical protein